MKSFTLPFTGLTLLWGLISVGSADVTLRLTSRIETGIFDEGASEISDYDPVSKRLLITNGAYDQIDIVDLSDVENPVIIDRIDITPFGASLTSVAVNPAGRNEIAVAIVADPETDPGKAVFFNVDGDFLSSVTVGALPDHIHYAPDGQTVLTADEGQPSDDYTIDPEGSVSIIDVKKGAARVTQRDVRTASFVPFNAIQDEVEAAGIRIFGPGATVAQDLEPEFMTISIDSRTAWVTLQENNAIAEVDIRKATVTALFALGTKDHSVAGNGLDASDRDGGINITTWPVHGLYQPDSIASYSVGGKLYLVTANEGDARDYDGFSEEFRIRNLVLDPTAFPDAATLQLNENLGRLRVTSATGDTDGDGDFDQLFSYGGRSFSIWTNDGELVFDSGDQFEQITSIIFPDDFNSTNDRNGTFDARSDDKGPEPEDVVVGKIGAKTYAFIGLERIGGIMIYDVTDPRDVQFSDYINSRDFAGDPELGTAGDLAPEGLLFIPASRSPNHKDLLVVAFEVSGTTAVFEIVPSDG